MLLLPVLCSNLRWKKYLHLVWDAYVQCICIHYRSTFLHLDISQILLGDTLEQINKGAIAELFVGLELIKSAPIGSPHQLYYWQRESRGSQAEVDYVIQSGASVLPIEVKSGTKGAMQSLRIFMEEKNIQTGVRCSLENFGVLPDIRIYPLYAAGQIK
jgi:predicted AAA+ superfamily ATPase